MGSAFRKRRTMEESIVTMHAARLRAGSMYEWRVIRPELKPDVGKSNSRCRSRELYHTQLYLVRRKASIRTSCLQRTTAPTDDNVLVRAESVGSDGQAVYATAVCSR